MNGDSNHRIRRIIVACLQLQIEPEELADEDPLFGEEDFDSIGSLEIIAALEAEFGIRVTDAELTEDLLASVRSLTTFVDQRREERRSPACRDTTGGPS